MKRSSVIRVRVLVPDGGAWRDWNDLSAAERDGIRQTCAERIGSAMAGYMATHLDVMEESR